MQKSALKQKKTLNITPADTERPVHDKMCWVLDDFFEKESAQARLMTLMTYENAGR